MTVIPFPTIDLSATGKNIQKLRQAKGYSIRDLQRYFGFQEPQAIYKWQRGECLPSVDNLFALSVLLEVPVNDILIPTIKKQRNEKPQAEACGFGLLVFTVRNCRQNNGYRFKTQNQGLQPLHIHHPLIYSC